MLEKNSDFKFWFVCFFKKSFGLSDLVPRSTQSVARV